jgi:hypothetical protein
MLRNKLVRSDGSIIDSSVIISCEFTEEVNSHTNLSVGDVTSSELSVEILSTGSIQQDEVLTYSIIEDGVEKQIGIFKAEKPTVATRNSMRFLAYDNIVKTEKLFSDWLRSNQTLFPMSLLQLVEHACSYCGVVLSTPDFPHADLLVNAFYADGITCRQILSWAGAIAGRFVRANVFGEVEFAWYLETTGISIVPSRNSASSTLVVTDDGKGNVSITSPDLIVTDDGAGNVSIVHPGLAVTDDGSGNVVIQSGQMRSAAAVAIQYLQGSLSYESYTTDKIERVQIKHAEDDVGVIRPADADGNCFAITGNMILGAVDVADVAEVAQSLYDQLKGITYVPFSVTIPRSGIVRAGTKLTVVDPNGVPFISYAMKVAVSPSGTTITATGDKSYDGNAAVASEQYNNLTGKVMTLSKSVDGLFLKNEDLTGKVSNLELTTEQFRTYVENNFVSEEEFNSYKGSVSSEFKQTAEGFAMEFGYIKDNLSDTIKAVNIAQEDIGSVGQSLDEVKAHIKPGILYYDDLGIPVYGIEVGQRTAINGEEVFNKYARFTSNRLSFFDQSDEEVAYISDRKLHITDEEILGSKTHGGFVESVQEDGSLITRWVK